jgi:hypothetical protein
MTDSDSNLVTDGTLITYSNENITNVSIEIVMYPDYNRTYFIALGQLSDTLHDQRIELVSCIFRVGGDGRRVAELKVERVENNSGASVEAKRHCGSRRKRFALAGRRFQRNGAVGTRLR